MRIGILVCGGIDSELEQEHGPFDSMFIDMLAEYGFEFSSYQVIDNIFPASVSECDGWLITGSKHGAYEPHPWIKPLEAFIRKAYAAKVPLAGICFGHQIMAQALGGKVEKFDKGWGLGQIRYSMEGIERPVEALAMHQDQVVKKPPESRVIASNDFCKYAGLAYNNPALSFQPHPEFTPKFMRALIDKKIESGLLNEEAAANKAAITEDNDAKLLAANIAEFFLRNGVQISQSTASAAQ